MTETTDTPPVEATADRQEVAEPNTASEEPVAFSSSTAHAEKATDTTGERAPAPESSSEEKLEKLTLQELLDAGLIHPLARRALDEERDKARQAEERMLRVLAETDNQRKRMQREQDDRIRYANESLLLEMLPVLDNLERFLSQGSDGANLAELRKGVELTLSQFKQVMEHVGVQAIAVAAGDSFDPRLQEAVFQDDGADQPEQTVVSVVQSGFKYRERVLRPARVVVSSGKGHKAAGTPATSLSEPTGPFETPAAQSLDRTTQAERRDEGVPKEGDGVP